MPSVVMSVHRKTMGGECVGDMVVSAEVLAHPVHQHDNARDRLTVLSGPAIAGEPRAIGGSIGERVGHLHSKNIKMVRPKQSSLMPIGVGGESSSHVRLDVCPDVRVDSWRPAQRAL